MSIDNNLNGIIKNFYYEKKGKVIYPDIEKEKDQKEILKKFELEQGDIITEFPEDFIDNEFITPLAYIIGNYSCDIPKTTTSVIQLLPILPYNTLNIKLFTTFTKTFIEKEKKEEIIQELKNLSEELKLEKIRSYFSDFNKEDKKSYIDFIKKIFQFKDRNFFLICPHKLLNNQWCFVGIQMIISIKKQKIYPEMIKYINFSISNPWKEKFGSIIGSRFDNIAVETFSRKQIRTILSTQI